MRFSDEVSRRPFEVAAPPSSSHFAAVPPRVLQRTPTEPVDVLRPAAPREDRIPIAKSLPGGSSSSTAPSKKGKRAAGCGSSVQTKDATELHKQKNCADVYYPVTTRSSPSTPSALARAVLCQVYMAVAGIAGSDEEQSQVACRGGPRSVARGQRGQQRKQQQRQQVKRPRAAAEPSTQATSPDARHAASSTASNQNGKASHGRAKCAGAFAFLTNRWRQTGKAKRANTRTRSLGAGVISSFFRLPSEIRAIILCFGALALAVFVIAAWPAIARDPLGAQVVRVPIGSSPHAWTLVAPLTPAPNAASSRERTVSALVKYLDVESARAVATATNAVQGDSWRPYSSRPKAKASKPKYTGSSRASERAPRSTSSWTARERKEWRQTIEAYRAAAARSDRAPPPYLEDETVDEEDLLDRIAFMAQLQMLADAVEGHYGHDF